ncbi:hypothetical protein ACHAW6_011041 [Cyclotella cf. meneghiniana]
MITSLDNLANAAVQKNDTVERLVLANKLLMDTVAKLQGDNAKLLADLGTLIAHQNGTPKDTVILMAIASPLDTTAKLAGTKSMGIKMRQRDKTRWVVTKTTKQGNQKADAGDRNNADNEIVNLIYFTPGCTNPSNLDYTVLLDTAANISLLTPTEPSLNDATTLPVKTIMQLFSDTLTTSGNVLFTLPKLPQSAKQAYQIAGLTNNLLLAAPCRCRMRGLLSPHRV